VARNQRRKKGGRLYRREARGRARGGEWVLAPCGGSRRRLAARGDGMHRGTLRARAWEADEWAPWEKKSI
jgi:hypothetical protein